MFSLYQQVAILPAFPGGLSSVSEIKKPLPPAVKGTKAKLLLFGIWPGRFRVIRESIGLTDSIVKGRELYAKLK
jgi:hypothetical protein